MPRLPRVYIEGSLYHVTSMGNHGENIFRDKEDYMTYLELLKKYKEQDGYKLFSFVLMPQQLNLLIEATEQATISTIMHDIASSYTKYFNNRYQRKGHLFQERFKSVIIEKDPYLLSIISYMHISPVTRGLVTDPALYPYSSHLIYINSESNPMDAGINLRNKLDLKEEEKEILAAIARFWPDKNSFSEFFAAFPQKEIKELGERLRRSGILGSEQFLDKVRSRMDNRAGQAQEQEKEPEALERKSNLIPVLSVSALVLLFGAGTLLYIYNSTILKKEKAAGNKGRIILPQAQGPRAGLILTELDGTEWTIQVKVAREDASPKTYFDKLDFTAAEVSSKTMSEKGFLSSKYTLKVKDDGTFSWETMQRNAQGEICFWRGETDSEGKMSGVFSRKRQGEEAQDFAFTSIQYIYRR